MADGRPRKGLQLQTTFAQRGAVDFSLIEAEIPAPKDDEIIVRMEAAPINPSDIGAMFGPADVSAARVTTDGEFPAVALELPEGALKNNNIASQIGSNRPFLLIVQPPPPLLFDADGSCTVTVTLSVAV